MQMVLHVDHNMNRLIYVHAACLVVDDEEFYRWMLWQMVWIHCSNTNIPAISKKGFYFNKRFGQEAEDVGLIIQRKNGEGCLPVGVEPDLLEIFRSNKKMYYDKEKMQECVKKEGLSIGSPYSGHKAWICPGCRRTVRAYQNTRIICGYCMLEYIPYKVDRLDERKEKDER